MKSRFLAGVTTWTAGGVCAAFLLGGCVNRPTGAPVGEGGASGIAAPNSARGEAVTNTAEPLTPLTQASEAHPAPDNTPGVDKAETTLAADPSNAKNSLLLAFSYYKSKAFAQAAPQFVQAAQLAPRDPAPLLYLGYTQMSVGALSEAQKTFADVIKLPGAKPEIKAEANLQIGNCLWALQQGKEAVAYFEKALQLNPKEGHAALALGTWEAAQQKPAEAKAYFEKAVADLPTKRGRAQAYACLGRLAEDAKNPTDARAAYQKAAQLDSDNEWATKALARLKGG